MEERKLLIDVHEETRLENQIRELGLVVERVPLETGDYCFGNILVERKTIDDYFASLGNGRLFEQLHKMMLSGRKCYLIIIGLYPYCFKRKKVQYKVVRARIDNMRRVVFQSFGVLLENVETEEDFIKYIGDLWVRANTKTYAPTINKDKSPQEFKLAMIAVLPGVGGKLSEYIAENYTLKEFMSLSVDDIANITLNNRKLGVSRAQKIREVLDL